MSFYKFFSYYDTCFLPKYSYLTLVLFSFFKFNKLDKIFKSLLFINNSISFLFGFPFMLFDRLHQTNQKQPLF